MSSIFHCRTMTCGPCADSRGQYVLFVGSPSHNTSFFSNMSFIDFFSFVFYTSLFFIQGCSLSQHVLEKQIFLFFLQRATGDAVYQVEGFILLSRGVSSVCDATSVSPVTKTESQWCAVVDQQEYKMSRSIAEYWGNEPKYGDFELSHQNGVM